MKHLALWLDHAEARMFPVDGSKLDTFVVRSPERHIHRHDKHTVEREHPADALHYFEQIARVLADAEEILVMGPATAKLELVRHLHKHAPAIEKKIVGVETVDHPTDPQIVAYAKKYFVRVDQLHQSA